jgi:hypothetical protein
MPVSSASAATATYVSEVGDVKHAAADHRHGDFRQERAVLNDTPNGPTRTARPRCGSDGTPPSLIVWMSDPATMQNL